jgi:hypothetical protein
MNAPAVEDDTMARAGRILALIGRGDRARLEQELGRPPGAAGIRQTEREELLSAVANRMLKRLREGRAADEGPEAEAEIWLLEHLARHAPKRPASEAYGEAI